MTPVNPSVAAVIKLVDHLECSRKLETQDRELIITALKAVIASRFQLSIDVELGLRKRGGIPVDKQFVLLRRDRWICRVRSELQDWSNLPPLAAAKLMSISARRYETERWPRERLRTQSPPTEPAATWWRILRIGEAIPSAKRIQQILELETQSGL